jgi:hypothetical protein
MKTSPFASTAFRPVKRWRLVKQHKKHAVQRAFCVVIAGIDCFAIAFGSWDSSIAAFGKLPVRKVHVPDGYIHLLLLDIFA